MVYYSLILNSSGGLKFISLGSDWCFLLTHGVNQLSFQLEKAESSLTQLLCSRELFPLCLQKGGTLKALAHSKFSPSWTQLGGWILAKESGVGDFFCILDFFFFFLKLNIYFFKLSTWPYVINSSSFPLKMEPENLTCAGVFQGSPFLGPRVAWVSALPHSWVFFCENIHVPT